MTFILRKEHEDAITAAMFARFKARAAAFLKENHPKDLIGTSDEELGLLIDRGVSQARAYGLTTERQLVRFLRATLLLNDTLTPDSRHESLGKLLSDDGIDAEKKSVTLLVESQRIAEGARHA